jgi:hypothetical protein
MRAGRFVLLPAMFGFVLLCGTSLQAQWATSVIEQDWTITVFGGRFGYEQSVIFPGGAVHQRPGSRSLWRGACGVTGSRPL